MKTRSTRCCLAVIATLAVATAQAGPGEDTANALNARYAKTSRDCGGPSKPVFLCEGVIIRATVAKKFWVPQDKNISSGGISASYLRKDARFKSLVYHRNSGFTLFPVFSNPRNKTYEVLCAYPNDAGTDNRKDRGCTDHVQTPAVESNCDVLGIMTGQDWIKRYPADKVRYSEICSFDVRDRRDAHAGPAFMAMIDARNLAGETLFAVQNELRIATWGNNPPNDPPVESTFYTVPPSSTESGLENARANQIEWWIAGKRYLPLVRLDLPATLKADARFSYNAADQAIQPTTAANACARYFDSARFEDLPATATAPAMKSLKVVPSACGREVRDDQTNNFFNELVAAFYRDAAWQGASATQADNVLSMRRQLTCHFVYRRYAPEWTLEPGRALIGIQESGAKQCDN